MSEQDTRMTKLALLERIQSAYAELDALVRPLSQVQLAMPGPERWAIKDHLTHLSAWELGIARLLRRQPRFVEPAVRAAVDQGCTEDELNDLFFRQQAGLTPAEALDLLRSAHHEMLAALDPLSEEDLYRPYESYLPEGSPGEPRLRPVLNWVIGNTYEHYQEHAGYIRRILASQD